MDIALFNVGGFTFRAEFTDFGLCGLGFRRGRDSGSKPLSERAKVLKKEIAEYFEGKQPNFSLPLDLEGVTDFQFEVYEQLLMIPYGGTVSYGEIAARVHRPKGSRAVGQAVRRNPIGIIIPCHRVIASDGGIGGFGGGREESSLNLKRELLSIEGVMLL
jgi:methylated-DNA-[protein]-cysteine S-methyltransferase